MEKSNIMIRLEKKEEQRKVENLVGGIHSKSCLLPDFLLFVVLPFSLNKS